MYENMGAKLKGLAIFEFISVALVTVISGICLIAKEQSSGWFVLIGGPFLGYVGSWVLYGLGTLIENTEENGDNVRKILHLLENTEAVENEDDATYKCGKCGAPGPYEGNCPNCGSSIKIHRM